MSKESKENSYVFPTISARKLYGRQQIFTDVEEITADNVIEVLNKTMPTHSKNRGEIQYLYDYYRGKQPILERVKEIRPEICNKIVENWANQIVSFKVGYLCSSPIQYISGTKGDDISSKVDKLNDLMANDSKPAKDRDLFEWQMICGTSYRMIFPDKDSIFETFVNDPRESFVIYKNEIGKKPIAGVYLTTQATNPKRVTVYTVYTEKLIITVKDNAVVSAETNTMGAIPIIEYPANNARLGAFEIVLDLLNAINDLDSNRIDGVEQFIQSLMIIYNATLGDETANSIREKGLIELKSVGEAKADVKILSEQLNQDQTQTLKEDIIRRIREIVGLPSQGSGDTSDSSNNGAQLLKGGWENAETRAKDSETMFKRNERVFLKVLLDILKKKSVIDLSPMDIDINFTRRNYENIQAKAQVLTMMLSQDKIHPKLAFESCGMFIDPEQAYRESAEYYESVRRTEQLNNRVDGDDKPAGDNEENN